MSDISMGSPAEDSVSRSTSILTQGEDEWLVIPATPIDKAILPKASDPDSRNEQPKAAKEELEILKEVLESTRAAFREEHETTLRIKTHLDAVVQELKATKHASEKEVADVRLELAAAREEFLAVKSQLEAAKYERNEKQDKFKSQAAVAATLFEKVKDELAKELEVTRVQLAMTRQELAAAKAELGAAKRAATMAEVAIRKEREAEKQELRAAKDQLDTTQKTFAAAKSEWKSKQEAAMKEFKRVKEAYEAVKRELEAHKQKLQVAKQELEALQREKAERTVAREKLSQKLRGQVTELECANFNLEQAKKALVSLKQKHQLEAKTKADERKTKEDAAEQAINLAATQAATARKQYQDMLYGWVVSKEAMETVWTRFQTLNNRYLAERKVLSDLKQSHEANLKKEVEERGVLEAEAEKRVKVAASQAASARKELQEMTEGEGAAVEVQFVDRRQARPYVGGAK